MLDYILPGVLMGLSAGFSPGPLMTLVISQTLRHGIKEGIKVSIAPFITDIPIVLIIVGTLSLLKSINLFLGLISVLGAIYLLYLAYESFKIKGFNISSEKAKPQSIRKGVLTNLLNPNPYIFYFSVAGPLILKSWRNNFLYGVIFIGFFLICLVVSKIALAFVAERSRGFFKSQLYLWINRLLGLLMIIFSIKLLMEGIHFLGNE